MSKTSIYSTNGGMAYQKGNTRIVMQKSGVGRAEVGGVGRAEVKENGEWRAARGYINPNHVAIVKAEVRGE